MTDTDQDYELDEGVDPDLLDADPDDEEAPEVDPVDPDDVETIEDPEVLGE